MDKNKSALNGVLLVRKMSKVNHFKWILFTVMLQFIYGEKQKEYCEHENFEARCGEHEVIRMQSALFGRMALNRCAKMDHGYIGCSTDVLYIIDHLCSGRRMCDFRIYDSQLKQVSNGCPGDIASYLLAEYKCIKVVTGDPSECYTGNHIPLGEPEGTIASLVTQQTGLGAKQCPWRITVHGGQTVRLTLLSFVQFDDVSRPQSACHEIAKIYERDKQEESVVLCPGTRREPVVYSSATNTIDVEIVLHEGIDQAGQFLIQYRAVGCADFPATNSKVVTRDGNHLVVHCNATDQTWYLVCRDTEWIGQLEECEASPRHSQNFRKKQSLPLGILLVVAVGVALGVFLGGLLLIIAHMHMKSKRNEKARRCQYIVPPDDDFSHTVNAFEPVSNCAQCTLERAKDSHKMHSPEYERTCLENEKLRDCDFKEYTSYTGNAVDTKQIQRPPSNVLCRPESMEPPRFV